jgi:transposase
MGHPGYPAEFRRKVLDLLAEGRSVACVAHDLNVSDQTSYNWRRQNRGEQPGLTTAEKTELAASRQRIVELGTECRWHAAGSGSFKEETSPKGGARGRGDRRTRPTRPGRLPSVGCFGVRLLRATRAVAPKRAVRHCRGGSVPRAAGR